MDKLSTVATLMVLISALFIPRETIKEVLYSLNEYGKAMEKEEWVIVCFAQLGALVLIRMLYLQIIQPLYTAFLGRSRNSINRYGTWGIIIADFGEDFSLVREYAYHLISNGMKVCLVDIGEGDEDMYYDDGSSATSEAIDMLVKELNRKSRKGFKEEDILTESFDDSSSDEDDLDEMQQSVNVIRYLDCADETTGEGEGDICSTSSPRTFCAALTSKLGQMTTSGGVGISINCCNPKQKSTLKRSETTTAIANKTDRFISTIQLILHYMMFREIGAVINVIDAPQNSELQVGVEDGALRALGFAECAFTSQVAKSIQYEYKEHGIDCLSVSLSFDSIAGIRRLFLSKPDLKVVVPASFRMLGLKSEMTLKDCRFLKIIDMIFS
jgi:hypothetical protein